MPRTAAQKILARVIGREVTIGEIVLPAAELITVHDWYIAQLGAALEEFGVDRLDDPSRVVFFTDHEPLAVSSGAALRQKVCRAVARRYGVERFFDVGRGGLGHIFAVEAGFVRPGMFASGYDTHITNYGVIGCYACAVVTEIAELAACGSVWHQVPETTRIVMTGELRPGVFPRDVAQALIGRVGSEFLNDAVVEFTGPAMASFDLDARYALVNTPMELGARTGFVEPDRVTLAYCDARGISSADIAVSDEDAPLRARIGFDLSTMEPQVACPPRPDLVRPVGDVEGTRIHHAYIGSCASGLLGDLRIAATLLNGRRIHPEVRLYVTPATQEIAASAARLGYLAVFIEAGAIVTTPGCGVCAGGRIGPVADGEASIGTGTRNDYGRLGSPTAELYLASPATVAASALAGHIADPRRALAGSS
jgi:homoaconitase/3-isopropylmalate dehydratase large subunit